MNIVAVLANYTLVSLGSPGTRWLEITHVQRSLIQNSQIFVSHQPAASSLQVPRRAETGVLFV